MKIYHKVIIIGSGPIGLYFASKCQEKGVDFVVLEGTDEVGGQLSHLYPEKEIVDIPGIKSIKAIDYVKLLYSQVDNNKIILNQKVVKIDYGNEIALTTNSDVFACEKLVIATGLGASVPRPLGVDGENDCENIIYSVKSFDHFKNKRIAIFGGGDSALDWAKEISAISDDVHLIHRRTEFRGNADTIANCKNLKVHLPYAPFSLDKDGNKATSVTVKFVGDEEKYLKIPVDFIFVNYGNIASPMSFPFEMINSFLKVDTDNMVAKNVFAIGDVCQYENKTRRIAPGLLEADKVLKLI